MKRSSLLSSLVVAAALAVPVIALAQEGSSTPPASTPATAPAKTTTTSTKSAKSSSTKSTTTKSATHMTKPDINSASKEDLLKVKGMTDADADKIIAGRPYKSVSDLKTKKIIDTATYNKVHAHLTAKKAA
ncbi:MAG TPA: helix-hairpin-helix domain-containing protein [Candidatus Eisenbacteria bacterium]|jgi:DNA uptake protein ComE-like DNA-binding protein|nr:helix-hairpin-helix domain-containing protein [Candidatus Eisenbacteria bacterium]